MCRVWGCACSGMSGGSSLLWTLPSPTYQRMASSPQSLCPLLVGVFRSMSKIHESALHPAMISKLCPAPLPGSPGDASAQAPLHTKPGWTLQGEHCSHQCLSPVSTTQTALHVPCVTEALMKTTPSDLVVNLRDEFRGSVPGGLQG